MCEKEMEQQRDMATTVKTSSLSRNEMSVMSRVCLPSSCNKFLYFFILHREKKKCVLAESWVLSSLDSLSTDDVC